MKQRKIALLMLLLMLVTAACGKTMPEQTAASQPTKRTLAVAAPTTRLTAFPVSTAKKAHTPAPSRAPVTPLPSPKPTPSPQDGLGEDGLLHVYLLGQGERVETPDSSFIRYLVYYPESRHLIINMNGKDYVFANVEESLWQGFKAAEVKGKYYNAVFRGKTEYHVTDYDGTNGNLITVHEPEEEKGK